ncbi:CCD63 protein, partial [Amia calva]|nr:CCD63 protein [Amia calva]
MPRGRSATSVHSDSSEMDIDGIAESELAKLQRQFRIMEGDRQAYGVESQDLINRQLAEIEKLQQDQEELQRSLRVSESRAHRKRDQGVTQSLQAALEHKQQVEEQLRAEKLCVVQLEQEIADLERKLSNQRRGGGSATRSQKPPARKTQKACRTLENKLERALTRFNEQLTKNGNLREELDTLWGEQARFQQLFRRLDKELQEIRKEIGAMIDTSTAAYDARVESQSKIVLLKEKAVKDLAQYSAEMKELERVIAHDRLLKEFMTTKSHERTDQDEGRDTQRRPASEEKERRKADPREDTPETMEAAYQHIQSITREKDLDVLVKGFIEVEDRNFALFNYVNEQNNEAETLQDSIGQIQQEMEHFRSQGQRQQEEHRALMRDIEQRQRDTQVQMQDFEHRATAASKALDQLKTGVDGMFQKMECDRSVIEDMLGSSAGIRDTNVMTFLGLVEQKTSELLTVQSYLNSKDYDKEYDPKEVARVLLGQSQELPIQYLSIQPPSTGEDYDTEDSPLTDEEERPLTQTELRQRIMKGVLRKEKAVHPDGGKEVKASKTSVASNSKRRSQEA